MALIPNMKRHLGGKHSYLQGKNHHYYHSTTHVYLIQGQQPSFIALGGIGYNNQKMQLGFNKRPYFQ